MKHTFLFPVLFFFLFFSNPGKSQDSIPVFPENYKRNAIKWNLTPFILWSKKNINLSYERLLSPHRSFSVNAGYFELPSGGIYDSLDIKHERKKGGFTVSGDYRYYFKNRNKKFAPDGLYWGIFASYHYYEFQNDITILDTDVIDGNLLLDGNLNIISAGVELGYQFAIKEHWTVDLVFMGPALTAYNTHLGLSGDIDSDLENEYLEAIYDLLKKRYPGIGELVETGERNTNGFKTSFGFGLRYLIQVGYRF